MEEAYQVWKAAQTPDNMGKLLDKASPVLESAVKAYGGGNPALMPYARKLAVGAFSSYDPAKGTQLRTHLMTQLQPLGRRAREFSQVTRVPERAQLDLYHVNQAHQILKDAKGRDPSDKELADHTGLSIDRIAHVRKFSGKEVPESMMRDDEGGTFLPGTSKLDPRQVVLEYLHHDLDPVDQQILEWKTGYRGKEMLSNLEIARRVNLSPGAVSQRAAKIAKRMNEHYTEMV